MLLPPKLEPSTQDQINDAEQVTMQIARPLFRFLLLKSSYLYNISAYAITDQSTQDMTTTPFLGRESLPLPLRTPRCSKLSLDEATATQLLAGLEQGCFSSVDLVNTYIARIKEVNSDMRVVMEVNPDALSIAERRDSERSQGLIRGSMHGLPVLIKANIGTRDQMQTNAGSFALKDAVLPEDSQIATRLRKRGLIILGKASMAEWAYFRSNNVSHGWNPVFGVTKGAYYDNQCPGASSGGSAVACDLGLAWATIGTETEGSIIIPSERNNIVGIKPTVGLTSRYLVVPLSERQDTVGPMARTVKDAARLLYEIAGHDPKDQYTSEIPFKGGVIPYYPESCRLNGLKGKRIGIARNVMTSSLPLDSYIAEPFEKAIEIMKTAGAQIVENVQFLAYDALRSRGANPVIRADFLANIEQYLVKLDKSPKNIHNIHDLREFTQWYGPEEYPLRDTSIWDNAIAKNITPECAEYQDLVMDNLYYGGKGGVLGALESYRLDVIAIPSAVAFDVAALVGSPIISVPLGAASKDTPVVTEPEPDGLVETAPGLPMGISFLGRKWSEELLIEIAYSFEKKTGFRGKVKEHRIVNPRSELVDAHSKGLASSPLFSIDSMLNP